MMSTKKRRINTKAVPTVAFKNKNKFKKKFKDPWEKYKGKLNVKGVKFLKKINGDSYVCTVTVKYYKGTGCGMGYHVASSVKTGIGVSRSKTLAKKRGKLYAIALAKKSVRGKLRRWVNKALKRD